MNRVFVRGMGVVSSIGVTLASFWDSLAQGKGNIGCQELDGERLPYAKPEMAAFDQVWPRGWREAIDDGRIKEPNRQGDATKYALCAVRSALEDAGYGLGDLRDREVDLYVGTSSANFGMMDDAFRGQAKMTGASHQQPATYVAMNEGFVGERFTLTNACTSSSDAIGLAFRSIRDHQSDLAIAVGTEGGFIRGRLLMATQRNILSRSGSILPFDRHRDGTVFGEGAAALVLSAKPPEQGPTVEVVGYTSWCGGTHPMNAEAQMIERCMRTMLDRSSERFDPSRDIFAPNASGTVQGDRAMAEAMFRVFGAQSQPVSYVSRALHGHLVGASGAVETIGLILTMKNRVLPACPIFDAEFDWVRPSLGHRLSDECLAFKVSVGLGGNYSCLMLKLSPR